MNDWNELKYNLPQKKLSKAEIKEWLRTEISPSDLADIIIEVLCHGGEVWKLVSDEVVDVLKENGEL